MMNVMLKSLRSTIIQSYLFECIVVVVSVLFFIYGVFRYGRRQLNGSLTGDELYKLGGFHYSNRTVWRSLTSLFTHSSFNHLYNNLFNFVVYAYILENISALTSFHRCVVFVLSGMASTVLSSIRFNRNIVSVGAFGGVMGLNGAILYVLLTSGGGMSQTFFMVILLTTLNNLNHQIFSNFKSQSKVNVLSHIYGLITGFIIASVLLYTGKSD